MVMETISLDASPEDADWIKHAKRTKWSDRTKHQIGAYTEYFVKMELTRYGFEVYTPEVDDHGIDFIARHGRRGPFIEIQVKGVRKPGYVFMRKEHFQPHAGLFLALGTFFSDDVPPLVHLIPSITWLQPDQVFVSRDYGSELKSAPEWGINLSKKNLPLLERFRLDEAVLALLSHATPPSA